MDKKKENTMNIDALEAMCKCNDFHNCLDEGGFNCRASHKVDTWTQCDAVGDD
jgi:hypothetical protein